jgi:transcription antitermination factor NusG
MVSLESADKKTEGPSWFAVQVKTTHEKRVATLFDYKGYEWFVPQYLSRRRWSDRIKEVELPLFPGYVFCRFSPGSRVPILKTPSVLRVVGIGPIPTPIDEREMVALQAATKSGLGISPHPFMQVGQWVRINGGSLYGLEGLIADVRQRDRLILSVTLLQRSVAVEIDSGWVVPIHSPAPYASDKHRARRFDIASK